MNWLGRVHDFLSIAGMGLIGIWLMFEARASMRKRNDEIERSWNAKKRDEEDNGPAAN